MKNISSLAPRTSPLDPEFQTSARNQWRGKISAIRSDPVDAEVHIDIGGENEIVSVITSGSVSRLGLMPGKPVLALVKASAVILMAPSETKTSARNHFCGTVTACKAGAVNGEVTLGLKGGGEVVAIITNESLRKLGLRVGAPACALVKASNVILAVED